MQAGSSELARVAGMPRRRAEADGLDYEAVRAYWEEAAEDAESASYMAHEQGLPPSCVEHRFALERAVVDRWFADGRTRPRLLDVGCGAGAWTELFAQRYGPSRRRGRERRHAGRGPASGWPRTSNVELVLGDARTVAVDGEFQGVLLGGLLMYLDRADAVALLVRLGELAPSGRIILRESGVRSGVEVQTATYQVVYRSVQEYETLAAEAGLRVVAVERNRGYAHMEIAVNVVDHLRRVPVLRGSRWTASAVRSGGCCRPQRRSRSTCCREPSKLSESTGHI